MTAAATSGSAAIKRQEAAESLVADYFSFYGHRVRIDKFVANALVITLGVVVRDELADGPVV